MNDVKKTAKSYLYYCKNQKRLDDKTIKAYKADLYQFIDHLSSNSIQDISSDVLEQYIALLHQSYKPKTSKRKIASIKAFFKYLEYKDIIIINPFNKLNIKFREPIILPKTIPLSTIEILLSTMYKQFYSSTTLHKQRTCLRDIAVIELLFATGIRISELCSLKIEDVNLQTRSILIFGKGKKERLLHIGNDDVFKILNEYYEEFFTEINLCRHFFANTSGLPLSDQSVRRMIRKYSSLASIDMRITPHMFRHTFATSLLEADVDIRYIQEMLGHSSINVTEIYTHVALSKQIDILSTKQPRKGFRV